MTNKNKSTHKRTNESGMTKIENTDRSNRTKEQKLSKNRKDKCSKT